MPPKSPAEKEHIEYHKDGSIWARGPMRAGVPAGYWEWFRKDGTKMRSGTFENGAQTGDWTTYDQAGRVYKVTTIRSAAKKRAAAGRQNKPVRRKNQL
jgi:antitoxin component YwqK of YwqJK toxin-antitoxin module